jgi:MFS family permease
VTGTEAPPFARDRRIQAWAVCTGISAAGDAAWWVALAWTATSIAGPAAAGLVLGVGSLPRAVMALFGGALADRLNARKVMVSANLARIAVLVVAAGLVNVLGATVPLLVCVVVPFGAFDAIYNPASATLPRQMVRVEDLPATAGLFQIASRIARFVGAPLGGLLVAFGGLRLVMVVDAASFAVVAAFLALALRPRFARTVTSTGSTRRDLAAGFTYLRHTAQARTLVLSLSGLNLFVGPALAVGVALHVHDGQWSSATLGVADALVGVGAAVGAAYAMKVRVENPARSGLLILVGQAAAIAIIGFASRPVLLLATSAIGVTAGLASAQLSGAFQQLIDPAFLGRMSSLTSLGDDILMPAAMAGFGALTKLLGLSTTCVGTGVCFAALVLWGAAGLRRTDVPDATAALSENG